MQIWATGDPTSADAVMSENVRCVDLLFVQETRGREKFKKMIHNVFKVSPCQGHITTLWLQTVHGVWCCATLQQAAVHVWPICHDQEVSEWSAAAGP